MAISRYSPTPVIDDHHYGTWSAPARSMGLVPFDAFEGIKTFEYVIKKGDRADHIARRFLNDESYWWIICLGNGINYPFSSGGWTPGRTIKIPYDISTIIDRLQGT